MRRYGFKRGHVDDLDLIAEICNQFRKCILCHLIGQMPGRGSDVGKQRLHRDFFGDRVREVRATARVTAKVTRVVRRKRIRDQR